MRQTRFINEEKRPMVAEMRDHLVPPGEVVGGAVSGGGVDLSLPVEQGKVYEVVSSVEIAPRPMDENQHYTTVLARFPGNLDENGMRPVKVTTEPKANVMGDGLSEEGQAPLFEVDRTTVIATENGSLTLQLAAIRYEGAVAPTDAPVLLAHARLVVRELP